MPRGGYTPGRRPSTGRPSKGERETLISRVPVGIAVAVREAALASGVSVSDWLAEQIERAIAARKETR